jgi:hypothetical protein
MNDRGSLELKLSTSLADIDRRQWNDLVGDQNVFFEHEFLLALEVSGCVGAQTSWHPHYATAWRGATLVGAVPSYLKWDSYGEFIFDWQWAGAYERAGLQYYPKAVAAVPFTPATGSRILLGAGEDFAGAGTALVHFLLETVRTQELSGMHFLFVTEAEHDFLSGMGMLSRITHQFHWQNRGYGDFEDFLADLRSKKRKSILRERGQVAEMGLDIRILEGDAIEAEHMDAMWRFYIANSRGRWSDPYLNRAMFDRLLSDFRHRMVLVMAGDGNEWVAGTLNFRRGDKLYGRYWGAAGYYPALHFECCFYRLIEYAIANGIQLFEAGAQGEQKFLRGFVSRPTYSCHAIVHPGARRAIADFLTQERRHSLDLIEGYNRVSPLKHVRAA